MCEPGPIMGDEVVVSLTSYMQSTPVLKTEARSSARKLQLACNVSGLRKMRMSASVFSSRYLQIRAEMKIKPAGCTHAIAPSKPLGATWKIR